MTTRAVFSHLEMDGIKTDDLFPIAAIRKQSLHLICPK